MKYGPRTDPDITRRRDRVDGSMVLYRMHVINPNRQAMKQAGPRGKAKKAARHATKANVADRMAQYAATPPSPLPPPRPRSTR